VVLDALASSLRWVARGLLTGLAVLALALGAGVPATAAPASQTAPAPQAAPAARVEAPAVAVESPTAATGTTDASVEHRAPFATSYAFHCGQPDDPSIQRRDAGAWSPAGSRPGPALGQRAPPLH
jgi:hypothetical protein